MMTQEFDNHGDGQAQECGQADVHFDAQGLIPVIAQDHASGRVLMVAWMNRDTLAETAQLNEAVYWSRSRQQRWLGLCWQWRHSAA